MDTIKIPSAKPYFHPEDLEAILADIRSTLESGLLTLGPKVEELETLFAQYCGVTYAVAVNSGTSALEIALRYFDIEDKEVIVPTNSFVASANSVIFAGGHPILADIREDTLCIDAGDVISKITSKTAGIMVVHLAGLICPQMDQLQQICRERGLFLMEDAAQAHGATLNGRKAGSLGNVGCFSFYPTKPMTTGEGGVITTDDPDLAKFARSIRNHGIDESGHYDKLGYNWRMSELNAIVGIYQLKRLDENIEERNRLAKRYQHGLGAVDGVEPIPVPEGTRHSYYKYPVLIAEGADTERVHLALKNDHHIATGALYYPPIHMQPYYKHEHGYRPEDLPVAKRVLAQQICLPMFVGLSFDHIDHVVESVIHEVGLLRLSSERRFNRLGSPETRRSV